jgi:chromosome condensin MukBEF MukE localization factor
MCRFWIDSRFDGTSRQRLVNQVLGNLCRLHYPGMVTLLGTGEREITTSYEHYRFAPDGDYGTTQGVV